MKIKISTLLFFSVLIFFSSCNKDDDTDPTPGPPEYWGEAHAGLNGHHTNFSLYGFTYENESYLNLKIDTINAEGFRRGSITVQLIPLEVERYRLYEKWVAFPDSLPYAIFFAIGADGDAIYASYHLLESDTTNYVELTDHNTETNEITGTFEMTFAMDTAFLGKWPFLEDTVRFENGYFHTKVYNY